MCVRLWVIVNVSELFVEVRECQKFNIFFNTNLNFYPITIAYHFLRFQAGILRYMRAVKKLQSEAIVLFLFSSLSFYKI